MSSSWICVDASLLVRLMTAPDADALEAKFAEWEKTNKQLAAPSLLHYEVTNALYQYHRHNFISRETLSLVQDAVLALPVQLFNERGLHKTAVQLAAQLNLPATYDAHYLALARQLGAVLWTADKKLVNAVQSQLNWVHLW